MRVQRERTIGRWLSAGGLARAAGVLGGVAGVGGLAGLAEAAPKKDYGLCFWSKTDADERIVWSKVLNEIKGAVGRAKQLNYWVDACYAGNAITKSDPTSGIDLGVAQAIMVATPAERLMRFGYSSKDNNPAGRLKVGDTFYYSFNDYVTKRLQSNDPVPTIKQVFDAAKQGVDDDKDIPAGRVPQKVLRSGGDDALKISGSAAKNRTIIFGADTSGMYLESQDASAKAWGAYTPDSLVYYNHNYLANASRTPPLAGSGTWANFKTAMGDLKTQLAAGDEKTQMVNLVHVGHGTQYAIDDGAKPGNRPFESVDQPGEPAVSSKAGVSLIGQGREILGADGPVTLTIPTDSDFWFALKTGLVPPVDDEVRVYQPRFHLAYAFQDGAGPVNVSIGGLPLGTFALGPASSGQLEVPLSDGYLSSLIAAYDGLASLPITLSLGASSSFLRMATLDDLLHDAGYQGTSYGSGISTVIVGVPAPGAAALLLSAGVLASRRRRGANARGY
jgi:hypothetical protein